MEKTFSIRIDCRHITDNKQLFKMYNDRCNKVLVILEKEPKEHYHIVVHTKYSQKTIRENTKKYLIIYEDKKLNQNRYMIKNTESKNSSLERALWYICKGESSEKLPIIAYSKGYTKKQIKEFHKVYWENNKVYKKNDSLKGLPLFTKISEDVLKKEHIIDPIRDHLNSKKLEEFIKKIKIETVKYYIKAVKTFPTGMQLDCVINSVIAYVLTKLTYDEDDVALISLHVINKSVYMIPDSDLYQTKKYLEKNF